MLRLLGCAWGCAWARRPWPARHCSACRLPSRKILRVSFHRAVTASDGGCANGGASPAGVVTFTFGNFTDSFINGLPATSPTEAPEAGSDLPDLGLAKIAFSFSWLGMGSDTTPQTIFFDAPGGGVSAVLNFVYSREGLDLTNVFGYVIASGLPVSAAASRPTASFRLEPPPRQDPSISPTQTSPRRSSPAPVRLNPRHGR